jgi:glucose-6-phosphate 1-dehydrogenase
MQGNGELFGREDIVDAQWRIVEDILDDVTPLYTYAPGSWGPDEANQLIAGDGPWQDPGTAPTSDNQPIKAAPL